MAASTITVGIAVIHREAVTKAGTLPGRGMENNSAILVIKVCLSSTAKKHPEAG
jgi:hypothetical protein